jgi:hypothetical protein
VVLFFIGLTAANCFSSKTGVSSFKVELLLLLACLEVLLRLAGTYKFVNLSRKVIAFLCCSSFSSLTSSLYSIPCGPPSKSSFFYTATRFCPTDILFLIASMLEIGVGLAKISKLRLSLFS